MADLNNKNILSSIFNSLYWKISATFLVLLFLIGCAYVYITADTVERYHQEKNQQLNAAVAQHIVTEVQPTIVNGQFKEEDMDHIMHSMMVLNPSIEVYLLDNQGSILNYVAPYKKVKLESVDLKPVQKFLLTNGQEFVLGDDPRNPGVTKEFSVAPIKENDQQIGYVYVILASEESDNTAQSLVGDYLMRLGGRTMILTLGATLVIGLLVIWLITRNLQKIIDTVRSFQSGNLEARVPVKSKGELSQLATSFNEMADTIVQNIEQMKATENLRRELIANVSHDLRTPIAIIHGYVETMMMKETSLNEEDRKKYMNTILESTEKLKKLVADLFELSKLEAKEIEPHKEPFFISELIQDISQKHKLIAEEKSITILPVISKDIPMVHADISLIERVLQNLIDNAIKFTNNGGIITIETHMEADQVEIMVSDTGEGIPEEEIPHIFERYHTLSKAKNKLDKVSTGLGLAIVKKILEIHNSTIGLKSKLHQGSSFYFSLPPYRGK